MADIFYVYDIDTYKHTQQWINDHGIPMDLPDLLIAIEEEGGLHERLSPSVHHLYGDIDYFNGKPPPFTWDEIEAQLCAFINTRVIQLLPLEQRMIPCRSGDIKFTENKGKPGSYHIVIPLFRACSSLNKALFKEFFEGIGLKDHFDESIYGTKWFRLPNQLKGGERGTQHEIVIGEPIDFILNRTDPRYSILLSKPLCPPITVQVKQEVFLLLDGQVDTRDDFNRTRRLVLECLSDYRAEQYLDWVRVCYALGWLAKGSPVDAPRYEHLAHRFSSRCPEKYNLRAQGMIDRFFEEA